MKYKTQILIFLYTLGGILDATTDLMKLFLEQVDAPEYISTLIRIIMVSIGVVKTSQLINKQLHVNI